MLKSLRILVFSAMMASTSALVMASGIPTVDVAAIAQMVQQLLQLQQMYSQLQQQYNTAVNTLNNFTGSRGLGLLGYNKQLRQFLPADFQSRMDAVLTQGTGALSSKGKEIYQSMKLGEYCSGLGEVARKSCEFEQAGYAEYQANVMEGKDRVTQRLNTIESLMEEINQATDMKSISELQARIASEEAALKASQMVSRYQEQIVQQQMDKTLQIRAQKEVAQSMAKPDEGRFNELLSWK